MKCVVCKKGIPQVALYVAESCIREECDMNWQTIDTAPVGPVVWTKIDDDKGARNEAPLYKSGNLWFITDGSMYVYYTPTHWRHLTHKEELAEIEKASRKYAASTASYKQALARITGTQS